MLVDIQCNPFNACIGGSQTADTAPFVFKVLLLLLGQSFGGLFKPQVDVFFVHLLLHKSSLINQRNDGAIVHRIFDGILVNQSSKLGQGAFIRLHKGGASKADEASIGEYRPHFGGQLPIIGAVAFIHQDKNILGQIFAIQSLGGVEFVDDGGHHVGSIALQELHQVATTGGSGWT